MTNLKTKLEAALGKPAQFDALIAEVEKLPVQEAIALSKEFFFGKARSKKQAIEVIRSRQRKLLAFVNDSTGFRAAA